MLFTAFSFQRFQNISIQISALSLVKTFVFLTKAALIKTFRSFLIIHYVHRSNEIETHKKNTKTKRLSLLALQNYLFTDLKL